MEDYRIWIKINDHNFVFSSHPQKSKLYPGVISELCRFCEEEEETFAHLLNECPCFLTAIQDILRDTPIINAVKWKPQTLLAFSNMESIDDTLKVDHGF